MTAAGMRLVAALATSLPSEYALGHGERVASQLLHGLALQRLQTFHASRIEYYRILFELPFLQEREAGVQLCR